MAIGSREMGDGNGNASTAQPGWLPGIILIALAIAPVFLPDAALWLLRQLGYIGASTAPIAAPGERVLRWSLSLVPSAVILHHALYLLYFRHRQFPTQRSAGQSQPLASLSELKQLYFGGGSIGLKYIVPLILTGALCSMMLAALLDLGTFSSWLKPEGGKDIHRAAAFGFVGAYLYVLLLLTQRAFRQDVTTGVALWTAAMFVVGPLTAAVFALFWKAAPGSASTASADVVYLVAGMLPRQFATIAQNLAQRLLQPSKQPTPSRSVPLTTIRGINADIEDRLSEEGIYDAATLAYADTYMLLQSTSFDRRQIVNWVDEALLITVFPDHWQAIEKFGITGAMDVAWKPDAVSLAVLAKELKIEPVVMKEAAQRLKEDPQVQDLYAVYWDVSDRDRQGHDDPHDELQPLVFTADASVSAADLDAILRAVGALPGVTQVEKLEGSQSTWRIYVRSSDSAAVRQQLGTLPLRVS